MCLLLCFSAEALSAVFTSDKLLLMILVNVLHPSIKKTAGIDSCSAVGGETSGCCSSTNKQYLDKAGIRLWRQKSATMPARQKCVSCNSRRLSEPLITSLEQTQTSQTCPDANTSQVNGKHNFSSVVTENLQLDGTVSKPLSSVSDAVSPSSKVGFVVTSACSDEAVVVSPVVVNPVYASDDCSTLKSLSFEKQDTRLHEHTSAPDRTLCVPEDTLSGFVSDQNVSPSLAQEDRCRTAVNITPVFSDLTTENFTFLEVPSGNYGPSASSCGYTDVSCQLNDADDEACEACAQFAYRKVCVYLQEGTWRHSPHSLHCIRIDDNISLVVLCEVTVITTLCYFAIVCGYNVRKSMLNFV